MIDDMGSILLSSLGFTDNRVPLGICDTGQLTMSKKKNGTDVTLPALFDFTSVKVRPATRDNNSDCLICKIGRIKGFEKHITNDQEKLASNSQQI